MKKASVSIILLVAIISLSIVAFIKNKTDIEVNTYVGQNISDVSNQLKAMQINIDGPLPDYERESYEYFSKKAPLGNQDVYHFWHNETYWTFPIGTTTYGVYLLVDDEIIIDAQLHRSVDSL